MNNCHIKHILLISFTFLIYYTLNSISVTFYFHNHFTPKILSSALLLGLRVGDAGVTPTKRDRFNAGADSFKRSGQGYGEVSQGQLPV